LAFASSPSSYAVMPSLLNPVNSLILSAAPAAEWRDMPPSQGRSTLHGPWISTTASTDLQPCNTHRHPKASSESLLCGACLLPAKKTACIAPGPGRLGPSMPAHTTPQHPTTTKLSVLSNAIPVTPLFLALYSFPFLKESPNSPLFAGGRGRTI
jgi:hypothetical protein